MAAARLAEAKADDAYVEQHRARYEAALSRALSQAVKERAPDPIARLAQLLQEPSAPMRSPSKLVAKQVTDQAAEMAQGLAAAPKQVLGQAAGAAHDLATAIGHGDAECSVGDVRSIPGLDEALSRALNAHAASRQNGDAAPTLPALLGSIAEDLMSQAQALLGHTGDPVPISVPESDRRMVRSLLALEAHVKALGQDNPSYPQRQVVPVELVNWDSGFPEYSPPAWTHDVVFANGRQLETGDKWADPPELDRAALETRVTFAGDGEAKPLGTCCVFDEDGKPLNVIGRTGLRGRGLLGKWGPNQGASSPFEPKKPPPR